MTLSERAQTADSRRRPTSPQDWARVQRLYAFCRARAIDRLASAQDQQASNITRHQRELHVLETMYGKARQQRNDIVTSCAVTYFRAQAMKDAQHSDFLGEWM